MFDMFDFENHDPERVTRLINDLWANPELYDWYNYAGDSEMPKSRIGNCMCWLRTVFVHATDIDRLHDVFELERKIMPYWIRDLYDAAMGYFDALDICGECPCAVTDEYWLEDIVYPKASECYQRRARDTYKHMSPSEQRDWDKLELDVSVMLDDYLRDVMPADLYDYKAAMGFTKMYDQYIKYLIDIEGVDTKLFTRYVKDPYLWYRDMWSYNPYVDPVVPIKPTR